MSNVMCDVNFLTNFIPTRLTYLRIEVIHQGYLGRSGTTDRNRQAKEDDWEERV